MHEDEVEKGVFVSSHNITLKHFSTSHALAFCWSWSRLKCTHSQHTNTHCHVEDIKWGLWECVTWIRHCPRLSTSFGKIKNEWKCLLWRIDAFSPENPSESENSCTQGFLGVRLLFWWLTKHTLSKPFARGLVEKWWSWKWLSSVALAFLYICAGEVRQ